jgi:hypothetical protein
MAENTNGVNVVTSEEVGVSALFGPVYCSKIACALLPPNPVQSQKGQ